MASFARRVKARAPIALLLLAILCSIYVYKRGLAVQFFDDNFPEKHLHQPHRPQQVVIKKTTSQVLAAATSTNYVGKSQNAVVADENSSSVKLPKVRVIAHKEDDLGQQNALANNDANQTDQTSDQGGCKLADLKVDDPELVNFFNHVPPLNCREETDWVFVGNGTFEIDPKAIKKHGQMKCNYVNFWRVNDQQTSKEIFSDFPSGSPLKGDFFRVQCKASDGAHYSNVHAGILPSTEAIKRARSVPPSNSALWGMNVYLLGFDSISRMTFMRKMPKLYRHLTETLGSVVLKGYNIVGDGTPQALIPILTSKTEVELPLTRKRFSNAQYVNVYPFVWNDYRDAGYVTLYGEDAASIGTFTYRLKGFNAQPTDHYMRTFYTQAEKDYSKNAQYCLGSLPHHVAHFRYVERFFQAYPTIPKFAFQFHSILSHDDINYIEVADDDMVKHLQLLENEGFLNNTMLILFSDHGHRFANLRETQQGKLEERLPFFSIRLPKWFEAKYPEQMRNLRANADKLTTPFDIYPTLKSVLNFDEQLRSPPPTANELLKSRAISLFQAIPAQRSCTHAQVEPHWCACLSWEPIDLGSALVKHMATSIIGAINDETAYQRKLCAPLELKSIDRAFLYRPSSSVLRYKKAKDYDGFEPEFANADSASSRVLKEFYQINFHTTPGGAHYEASLTYDKVAGEVVVDLDQVSHVNAYGDKPHCVIDKDYFLAKWCVCFDKI